MIKVDTGIPIVHCFDQVADQAVCNQLCEVLTAFKGLKQTYDASKLPWFDNDTQSWWSLPNIEHRRMVNDLRKKITALVSDSFQTTVYPTFTDLCVWRAGKQMAAHKDNGYAGETWLYPRVYTSVLYLNDNYQGGETFVNTQWGQYISKPRTGSMICLPSDESAIHGVNLIRSGLRFTMPIWFCTDPRHAEDQVYASNIVL